MTPLAPVLAAAADRQFGCFLGAQAVAAGYTRSEIQTAVKRGEWRRLRRGAYCAGDYWAAADARARHLAVARAAQLQLGALSPLSHATAALVHHLPLLGEPPTVPSLTVQREHRSAATGVRLHTARLFPRHVVSVDGAEVTTIARTISDLARTESPVAVVGAGDAALRDGRLSISDFEPVLADCWTWRGIARTKRVIAMLDGRAESIGESVSRVLMAQYAIAPPVLQHVLRIDGREYRSDFAWPRLRVVGEFDGRVKYGEAADLFAEKRREDAIRNAGWTVIRWVWAELWGDPPPFVRRLRSALAAEVRGTA